MGLVDLSDEELIAKGITPIPYDRSKVQIGIVHIGPSNFFRGFILPQIDKLLKDDPRWGTWAISLKTPHARDTLSQQDNIFTVTERSGNETSQYVVGGLQGVTFAGDDPKEAVNILSNPDIKVVTLTVTQDGYHYDPESESLDFDSPDIKACLQNMDAPTTAIGLLVASLERRMKSGTAPFTIISCDNMVGNGIILQRTVLAYAARISKELREWIKENVEFRSTMVDRIVPKTTKSDIFKSSNDGVGDSSPVMTETFMQWVIEGKPSKNMPDLERVGAIITDNIVPYELMKLRMVNGPHLALACIGQLAGYEFVNQAMEDPAISSFVDKFIEEAGETIPKIEKIDLTLYKKRQPQRFSNPNIVDDLPRVARNGTQQKVKPRILSPLQQAISNQTPYQHLAFAAATWIHYLKGYKDDGNEFNIGDENAIKNGLQNIARNSNGDPTPVMTASGLFDFNEMNKPELIESISRHLHNIQTYGVLKAIEKIETHGLHHTRKMAAQNPMKQQLK